MMSSQDVRQAYQALAEKIIALEQQIKLLKRQMEKLKYDCPHEHQKQGKDEDGSWRFCDDCHAQLWPKRFADYE